MYSMKFRLPPKNVLTISFGKNPVIRTVNDRKKLFVACDSFSISSFGYSANSFSMCLAPTF